MSAVEPLYQLFRINTSLLSKEENILLEAELFIRVCTELKEIFREQHQCYFNLMNFTIEEENNMLETKFARLIIKDILSTNEYTMAGIACYTDSYEEVVEEIIMGLNVNPSAIFIRRLIDLHKLVRREIYVKIINKIK